MARNILLEFRRGTAAQWTAANPTLAAGEPGWESDTDKLKIGDGATAWNTLAYFAAGGSGTVSDITSSGGTLIVTNPTGPTTNVDLPATGVAAGTYGDDAHVPEVTVDAEGRITGVALAAIPGVGAGGSVLLYDYTVAGAVKASIDTNVDGALAGLFPTSGYSTIEVFIQARTDEAVILSGVNLTLNNDGAANYDEADVESSTLSTTPTVFSGAALTAFSVGVAGSSAGANVAGQIRLTVHNYAGTTFFKTVWIESGAADTTAGNTHRQIVLGTYQYRSTSAVTRIKLAPSTAGKNLAIGTRLTIFAR